MISNKISREEYLRLTGQRFEARAGSTAGAERGQQEIRGTHHQLSPPASISRGTKLNKTEAEYERMMVALHGRCNVFAQAVQLQVGEDRCRYTPDFMIVNAKGEISFHEVKGGFYRDDARVKFQAAKLRYMMFGWVWAQKKHGRWEITL